MHKQIFGEYMKKVGILGSGIVGTTLADGFIKHGYDVMIGTRDSSKLSAWKEKHMGEGLIGSFAEAAAFGGTLVLAVKGHAASDVLKLAGISNLSGKTIIDATNPIADAAPVDGVLQYYTDFNQSLMEKLQSEFPDTNFVKCFSCVGASFMVDPNFPGGPPTMFICGNNQDAKSEVKVILSQFGWEYEDMGSALAARAIEPLAMLWCIPGIKDNSWAHAFKLLKSS
ncbi:MAG: 8-hydroxy-5-deazaflavin:NADPH oxidoreductase [Bacteroidota bacterium]|nr:8-hydroxy-5-deazaflavin:NADPH oxidoreductase [Bacteroidota bacterium]